MDRKLKRLFQLEKLMEERYRALEDEEKTELASLFSGYQATAATLRHQFDALFELSHREDGRYPCLDCVDRDSVCCRNCAGEVGYYSAIDILKALHSVKDWRGALMDGWGEQGFLTAKGCALPQELRSHNCTRQICSRYRGEVEGDAGELMDDIRENIQTLGRIYSKIEDLTGHDFSAF
jgi:hypothetical protein